MHGFHFVRFTLGLLFSLLFRMKFIEFIQEPLLFILIKYWTFQFKFWKTLVSLSSVDNYYISKKNLLTRGSYLQSRLIHANEKIWDSLPRPLNSMIEKKARGLIANSSLTWGEGEGEGYLSLYSVQDCRFWAKARPYRGVWVFPLPEISKFGGSEMRQVFSVLKHTII